MSPRHAQAGHEGVAAVLSGDAALIAEGYALLSLHDLAIVPRLPAGAHFLMRAAVKKRSKKARMARRPGGRTRPLPETYLAIVSPKP